MARITLQLPDDLYDSYLARAKSKKRGVAGLMAAELQALHPLDLSRDRIVVIDPENRQRLESLLGGGHLQTASDLTNKISDLLTIDVGGFSLDFTPAERHELAELASRNGFTAEQLTRATVGSMKEQFFNCAYAEGSKRSEENRVGAATEAEVVEMYSTPPSPPKPEPPKVPIPTITQGLTNEPPTYQRGSPSAFERIREALRPKRST